MTRKPKGYPYEVPPMLRGPVDGPTATGASIERYCREQQYVAALSRILRSTTDPNARAIAFAALTPQVKDEEE